MCKFNSATGWLTGGAADPPNFDYASAAQRQETNRQKLITQGTANINQAFSGFTPGFYDQRSQAYQNFALPQLAQQYRDTRNTIGFGLADRGLIGSGSANQQYGALNQQMGLQKQQIADTGRSQAQSLQQQIENQRTNLLNQLYQSADPTQAQLSATNVAAGFATPTAFPALGNMFQNLLNSYYAKQLIDTYKPTSYVQPGPQGSNLAGALGPTTYGGGQ